MKYLFIILLTLLAADCVAKEQCDPASIGVDKKSSEIERYFYTGTCHYRNKDFQLSVQNWEKLILLNPSSDIDEELKIDVLNNLGYMKFFGYGTKKDQKLAISYWRDAILMGHYEAEYHLCHAYADDKQPTHNLAKARKHCEKAQLIYKGKEDSDPEILSDINFYLKRIEE